MNKTSKEILLQAFAAKAASKTLAVCSITGIQTTIEAPALPHIKGFAYSYASPLAIQENAEKLGSLQYSELKSLDFSALAGAILSLFSAYKLRKDKLSAIEASFILCQRPKHELAQSLQFLSRLSSHEKKRIPHISLTEAEPEVLRNWLYACHTALDVTIFEASETISIPQIKTTKPQGILVQSILSETRKEARELLKTLKASEAISMKLSTIIQISIQKNNLAIMGDELRKNIISALERISLPEAQKLAVIFRNSAKNLTHQEAIVRQQFESSWESASDSFTPKPKKSIYEIIAEKKALLASQQQSNTSERSELAKAQVLPTSQNSIASQSSQSLPSTADYVALVKELGEEIEQENTEWHAADCTCEACIQAETESVEPEFLIETTEEELLEEAGLSEIEITEEGEFIGSESKEASYD